MREAHLAAAQLHQAQPHAPGRGQPDVEPVPYRVQPALDLLDEGGRILPPAQRLKGVELHLKRILLQADAGKHRQLVDGGPAILAGQRHAGGEVSVDQCLRPRREQALPELGPVHAAGVEPPVGPPCGDVLHQAGQLQLAGYLQVQGCLGDVCGLHHPVKAALILCRATLEVLQGGLLAERLELHERGLHVAERLVRPRGDDQRQLVLVGLPDGKPYPVVPLLVLEQCLLQAVGEHHDAVAAAELPPDLLPFRVRHQGRIGVRHEPLARELAEVKLPGVPQPHRNRNRSALGQQLGEPDQERGLAGSDPADDHMWTARVPVPQILNHHAAQLIPADDLTDDAARGVDHPLRLLPGLAHVGPADEPQADQQEKRVHEGEREQRPEGPGENVAGEAGIPACRIEIDAQKARRLPHDHHVKRPGHRHEQHDARHNARNLDKSDERATRDPGAPFVDVAAPPSGATRLEHAAQRPEDA